MSKLPRVTAKEAEKILLKEGYVLLRSKGSHRIYKKADKRIVIPFHSEETLHPKIVKQIYHARRTH